jgi:hypothetical protein
MFILTVFTTLTMVKERKKRVEMAKQLKREVFTACVVRVLRGTLAFGALQLLASSLTLIQRQ